MTIASLAHHVRLGSDVIDKKSSPLSSIQGSHVRKQIKRQSSEDMLKPQQVFSLTVDWNRSSQDMTNTLPPLNSPITTFISLSNIRPDISIDRLREVVIAFKVSHCACHLTRFTLSRAEAMKSYSQTFHHILFPLCKRTASHIYCTLSSPTIFIIQQASHRH